MRRAPVIGLGVGGLACPRPRSITQPKACCYTKSPDGGIEYFSNDDGGMDGLERAQGSPSNAKSISTTLAVSATPGMISLGLCLSSHEQSPLTALWSVLVCSMQRGGNARVVAQQAKRDRRQPRWLPGAWAGGRLQAAAQRWRRRRERIRCQWSPRPAHG